MSITVNNVSYEYSPGTKHKVRALHNINLTIQKAMVTAIIGHTGSGKSTLIQLMNGILKPTTGTIDIEGYTLTSEKQNLAPLRKKVGMVFQYPEYQLFEETVYKDIAFGPKNQGLSSEEIDARVLEAMEMVGLDPEDMKERSPFELSGGQKRKVAIAGVLAMNPSVLMLDEPTAGLDPRATRELTNLLMDIQSKKRITMIFISHTMEEVAKLADEVIALDKGRVLLHEKTKDVFGKVETLQEAGLDVPEITKFISDLNERGCDFSQEIFDEKILVDELLRRIG